MNDNKMHGRVLKKLREERGYKLKDVAGDVISTRTLMRFEADETSISISIFEKLLDNLNINYLDYFTFYLDNTDSETTEFANKLQKLLQSGSSSKLVNECKKELKKKDIDFSKRLTILIYLNNILWDKDKELFEENRRLIKDRIDSLDKLGSDEIYGLFILIYSSLKGDYSVEYIERVIEDCFKNIPVRNYLSKYMSAAYCDLLKVALSFLVRAGYYELAEKRCKETLKLFNENPLLINRAAFSKEVVAIMATLYLRQNKEEGVILANKILKYEDIVAEITGDSYYRQVRDVTYEAYCKVNKTGIDIEF
ncbi:helix-turn-helix transcriptional regulator [Gemella haemolysans]|uniref:Helix-turn-helix transcriptional regulator n=1 Tax=Gemella haemolysans TaxID=1379 RepID=A0AAW6B7F5_9BACL|nr:helix-turn-helix transcriptional regulator [Gemella haemolysans]MDB6186474.1 helix-turn-helix transcriptional regulator [Gemella haemolysans]MDU4714615.1 helix-turn-helix transcriptional regulator [Gemella haemolysans]